jgi:hypothetical protein
VFRSDALVLRGAPVAWDDLAPRGAADAAAVRELTGRIDRALRDVTVNLEQWQDQPLVDAAVRVWEAERGVEPGPADRVGRQAVTTRILAVARRREDGAAAALAARLERHRRRLERLRLRPGDLPAEVGVSRALRWTVRRAHLLLPLAAIAALAGFLAFYLPYRVTGALVARVRLRDDERSTWKLLVGIGVYAAWLALAVAAAALAGGWRGALLGLVLLPPAGMTGLLVRERWRGAWADARRFLLLRSRRGLVAALRAEQAALAADLAAVYHQYAAHLETR